MHYQTAIVLNDSQGFLHIYKFFTGLIQRKIHYFVLYADHELLGLFEIKLLGDPYKWDVHKDSPTFNRALTGEVTQRRLDHIVKSNIPIAFPHNSTVEYSINIFTTTAIVTSKQAFSFSFFLSRYRFYYLLF